MCSKGIWHLVGSDPNYYPGGFVLVMLHKERQVILSEAARGNESSL